MEAKLDEILREFRKGHREGSVISVQTFDSLSTADKEAWRSIRKELEDMGLSLAAFEANKDFIFSWLKKAIADGAFEEVAEDVEAIGSGSEFGFSGSASTTRPASPDQVTSGGCPTDPELPSSPIHETRSVQVEKSSPHLPRSPFSSPTHPLESLPHRRGRDGERATQAKTDVEQTHELGEPIPQKSDAKPRINVQQTRELREKNPLSSSVRASQTGLRTPSASSTLDDDDGMEPSPSSLNKRLEVTKAPSITQKAHYPSQTPKSHLEKHLSLVTLKNKGQDLINAITHRDPTEALELLRSQRSSQSWAKDAIYHALFLAVQKGFPELLEPLLVAGQVDINDHDLLECAVRHNRTGKGGIVTLQRLLSLGADPSLFGGNCVLRAIEVLDEHALRALLDAEVHVVKRMGSGGGTLPLHRAMTLHASNTMIQMIIGSGADVNLTDVAGQTPLGVAIAERRHEYVDILISHGADLEQPALFSGIALPVAPLMGAVTMDDQTIAKVLLDRGAFINKRYSSPNVFDVFFGCHQEKPRDLRLKRLLGWTDACALHAAVVHDFYGRGTLRMLLQEGAHTDWDIALILAFLNLVHRYRRNAQTPEISQRTLVAVLSKCSESRGESQEFRSADWQVFNVMAVCINDTNGTKLSDNDSYLRLLVDEVISRYRSNVL